MTGLKIGELFSGYGGLGMGVQAAMGGEVAWHVEYDKAPSKILAHHWPDVPNYGDITKVDWSQVEPVDILTGGSPCQDLSHAGKRGGMTEGTRSNLWVAMREAIAQLRPGLVVWENVRGAYSAAADSELEPCAGCVGDGSGVHLRALGRVLGDLSNLGYDCRWHGLRAADVGAPHGRFRVFVIASDTRAVGRLGWPHLVGDGRHATERSEAGDHACDGGSALLPTPAAYDGDRGGPQHPNKRRAGGHSVTLQDAVHGLTLLPTPAVNDMGEGKTVEAWDEWTAKMQAAHGNGNGHGKSLAIEAQRLMPTPRATDGTKGGPNQRGSSGDLMLPSAVTLLPTPRVTTGGSIASQSRVQDVLAGRMSESEDCRLELTVEVQAHRGDWGQYADAIARWEHLTRPAPAPTQPSKKGTPQLSPAFSEWMMGLPAGHVTDVPGLSRNDMLKALGNGVVPQQGAAALRFLLGAQEVAA